MTVSVSRYINISWTGHSSTGKMSWDDEASGNTVKVTVKTSGNGSWRIRGRGDTDTTVYLTGTANGTGTFTATFGKDYVFQVYDGVNQTYYNEADSWFTVTRHSHSYSYSKTVAPTCTASGYDIYKCKCGKSKRKNYTDKLGHSWNSGEITKEATYTEEGIMTYTCKRTGCGATTTKSIPKKTGGVVYIYDGSTYASYECYIDNGTTWDMCVPYIDNGTTWDACN